MHVSAAFREGLVAALGLPTLVLGSVYFGLGALAEELGLSLWILTLSTVLIWAGPAQVILFTTFAATGSVLTSVVLVSLSSVRLLPMCSSLLPRLREAGLSLPQLLLASHGIAVTVWLESMNRLPSLPVERRPQFFAGFVVGAMGLCLLTGALGYHLSKILPTVLVVMLLFLTPVHFFTGLLRNSKVFGDGLAIVFGFFVALATQGLPYGLDLVVAGLVGGTVAFAWHRWKHLSAIT